MRGRLTEAEPLSIPILHPAEPFRAVQSGDAQVSLDGGKLQLDLSEATITFRDGRDEGTVHAERLPMSALPVSMPLSELLVAEWGYSLQPLGAQVDGQVGVSMAVPMRDQSYEYLEQYVEQAGTRVVMLGVDTRSGTLQPVGLGEVDLAAKRVISAGPQAFQRLDVIAYALVHPSAHEHLAQFAAGDITLQALITALHTGTP